MGALGAWLLIIFLWWRSLTEGITTPPKDKACRIHLSTQGTEGIKSKQAPLLDVTEPQQVSI